jgi:hypothetical protein
MKWVKGGRSSGSCNEIEGENAAHNMDVCPLFLSGPVKAEVFSLIPTRGVIQIVSMRIKKSSK